MTTLADPPRLRRVRDDNIALMLRVQEEFQRMLGNDISDMDPRERMDYIRTQVLGLLDEAHEVLGETGWKPWAKSNHINTEAFHSEMVDVWHFFLNLMLVSGMTADDLYKGYMHKQEVNRQRQHDGYDGVTTKCPDCKRAYDDLAVHCSPAVAGLPAYCEVALSA